MLKNFSNTRPTTIPRGTSNWPLERVATDAGELWFPVADQVMREYARNSGRWDPHVGQVLLECCGSHKDGLFIDIGANVGYFSCLLSKHFPSLKTYAFEPQPLIHDVLALNAWTYGARIQLHSCALGSSRGTVALETAVNNLGDTRGVEGNFASTVAPLISLDELYPDLNASIVKIDVQGAELDVIRGMVGVIRRSPSIRIVVEFGPDLAVAEHFAPDMVLDVYRSLGFRILLIRNGQLNEASNAEILRYCSSAGPMAQADLLLLRA
ncbi:FkbM family methyltransferase [Xanthomonas oryzae pv. oryzae]|uniref:Putative methyltransferase n=2 Tax=Xanthomonas oryzae TaxID=347 RepID=A0A0K0GQ57_XANOP|nr:putative methyltransferase [Xanthomonas oryzae pv. oryzae PXO99A]AXM41425.1 FkbM family methyltransferase [Xanthomonas oryzae pv. oryzae]UEQ19524.1 FkbM family methyltransferase [Xanthomonas oryzae]RBC24037.1 FkbM family methyltransferase [Xanthomonas oryzae pv. oryzae]RBF82111.1 FkbM family methyltransferase [Xanthomonas oryzae pv. oryzae]